MLSILPAPPSLRQHVSGIASLIGSSHGQEQILVPHWRPSPERRCHETQKAVISWTVPPFHTNQKLALGNVNGVSQVDDGIVVEATEPESILYTVKSGDTLSKIAKEHYGNAMKYMVIFEANKPMLTDPDKIYVGQVLRIPEID